MIENVDVISFGWWYEIILVLLGLVALVDGVGIIRTLTAKDIEEKKEYADLCVKYLTLLMFFLAGGFFLLVAFTYGYDEITSAIHGVLGGVLIIEGIIGLFIKLKYGRRRK